MDKDSLDLIRILNHGDDFHFSAAFPRTVQVKAGENFADGALDRRAGAKE